MGTFRLPSGIAVNGTDVLVFGQTADAAYAVRCPIGHKADLEVLLKQTTLIAAPSAE